MAERSTRIKRPTQADVARRAGVSQPMVSYVLNGNEALPVPDETRQRIRDAIDELGYVPHRAARSLRTRKTYTLASIIPDITNPFYPAFQRGIQDVADQRGYDLVLYNTDGEAGKEHKCLHSVLQGRADAIIGFFFICARRTCACCWARVSRLFGLKPGRIPPATCRWTACTLTMPPRHMLP